MSIQLVDGVITLKVSSGESVLAEGTFNIPNGFSTVYPCLVVYSMGGNTTINYVKNIKVKPL